MSKGVQSEPGGEVAEHAGYGLDIRSVLQCNRSEGVAEVVEADFWDVGSCQHSFEHIVYAVRRDWAAVGGREYVFIVGFRFLLF